MYVQYSRKLVYGSRVLGDRGGQPVQDFEKTMMCEIDVHKGLDTSKGIGTENSIGATVLAEEDEILLARSAAVNIISELPLHFAM